MRQSNYPARTLKEEVKGAKTLAQRLLVRAGLMRPVTTGIYAHMPLLVRTFGHISKILRKEMKAGGFEEVLLPAVQPRELWMKSGRWDSYEETEFKGFCFKDRRGAEMCLAPAYEEGITAIMAKEISSYKHLPKKVFHIQTFFDEGSERHLDRLGWRETLEKGAYIFCAKEQELASSYEWMVESYHRICKVVGLDYRCVEAAFGRKDHRFIAQLDRGDHRYVYCDLCGYAAEQEIAESMLETYMPDEKEEELKVIYGPGLTKVEALAEFAGIPVWKTTKTLLFQADEHVVAVMVRGDCNVNEFKVKEFLGCKELSLAKPEIVRRITGAEVGYAGPIGLPSEVHVVADRSIANRVNFECGANKTDHHYLNVNFERDLARPVFGDFKLAEKGHLCPRCDNGKLKEGRGIQVGNLMKLGTIYTSRMNCTFQDRDGKIHPVLMGSSHFEIGSVVAALVEQTYDDHGIVWPAQVAPAQVHLIALNLEREEVVREAEKLYSKLTKEGIEVLYDDRDTRAGEKFSDADLLGIPIRLTVSRRTCKASQLEFRYRHEEKSELLDPEEVFHRIRSFFAGPNCRTETRSVA